MDSIGETLRRERLRRGLKLEQVAAETKIGQHLLLAIEENRWDRLPGGLFTRSFLRQYTHALALNEDEIVASLKQFEEPPIPTLQPPRQYKLSHLPRMPALAWFAVTMLACGGIFAVWENVRRSLPDTGAVAQHPATHGERAVLKQRASPMAPANADVRSVEAPVQVRTASQLGFGSGEAAMRVMFAATEPVWLAIKSDGINSYSGILEGQQSREFDASTKMTVLIGNAGGLAVSVNGKPVTLTGAHGEVRSLVLTPSGVQVVPRTPPTLMTTPQDGSEHPS
jgi:cytoskeleton protein RodZ